MSSKRKYTIQFKGGIIETVEAWEIRFNQTGFIIFVDEAGVSLYIIYRDDVRSIRLTPQLDLTEPT
jgi:hypothetical protein